MTTAAGARCGAALRWRALREDDVPAWHALVLAVEAADDPVERYTADDLRDQLLAGSWKDPATGSVAAEDADGGLVAFGLVDVRPDDALPGAAAAVRASLWGGVHPAWRGRGVGRDLLARQCAAGRRQLAVLRARTGLAVAQLQLHVDDRLGDRAALARAAGFTPRHHHQVMRRWLRGPRAAAAPPLPDADRLAAALPDGVRVVPWAPELDEGVRRAHNEAFADHPGSGPRSAEDWHRWVSGHRDARLGWSRVALDGRAAPGDEGEVVGYTVAFAFAQDWVDGVREGWTGLLGTRAAWRGRGVGGAVLASSVGAMAADGMDAAGLDVDTDRPGQDPSGARGLYERLGYAAHRGEVLWALDVDAGGAGHEPAR